MNEEAVPPTPHRSRARGQLLNRLYRYQVLLLKKWWVLVLGLALGLGGAGAVSWFGPPSCASVGRMIVSIKLATPEGSAYSEEMSSFLGTQSALMQSGVVASRAHARVAAQEPKLPCQPVALRVAVQPRTSIFVLQATGPEPEYTEAFLQACMEEYIAVKKDMRAQTSDTTVAGLTEEILRLEKELRKCDQELAAFQSTNGVEVVQDQGNSAANYLSALNQRLAALKSESELLQALSLDQNLERRPPGSESPPSASELAGFPANPGDLAAVDYLKAKQQLLLLKADQQDLAQYLRPKHPKMLALSDEIARRERLLEIFRDQNAEQLESRKNALAVQIQNLEREIVVWDAKVLDISRRSAEYQRLKANSQRFQGLYDRLLSTMQTLDVNKEASPESVTIMEKASTAALARPRLSRQLLLGACAGLGFAVLVLLILDRLDDRINSGTELLETFAEELLGQIPRQAPQRREPEPGLLQPDDARHGFLEAYRNLRSSLLYLGEPGLHPKTLLVTSSVPNEGKSITSANLAIVLASAGARVLLVDADLRKGALHHRFGLPAEPGLSDVLSGQNEWPQTVLATRFPNLSLLPRGRCTPCATEFFLQQVTRDFVQQTGAQYDCVVLDTAPVMAADDVTSLAPHAHGVLFIIRAEATSARVARAALDLLYQRQARVLGLVFNAVRPQSSDYYYYHPYQDYYRTYDSV